MNGALGSTTLETGPVATCCRSFRPSEVRKERRKRASENGKISNVDTFERVSRGTIDGIYEDLILREMRERLNVGLNSMN